MVLSIPVALAAGRWSDRVDRPIVPLAVSALVSAAGLIGMALAADRLTASAGFGMTLRTARIDSAPVKAACPLVARDRR